MSCILNIGYVLWVVVVATNVPMVKDVRHVGQLASVASALASMTSVRQLSQCKWPINVLGGFQREDTTSKDSPHGIDTGFFSSSRQTEHVMPTILTGGYVLNRILGPSEGRGSVRTRRGCRGGGR